MADTQFLPIGTESAPADWVIPGSLEFLLKACYAHFDGSGASDFVPTLEIISDAGETALAIPMDAKVAGGSSVDATWASFLRASGQGPPGPAGTVNMPLFGAHDNSALWQNGGFKPDTSTVTIQAGYDATVYAPNNTPPYLLDIIAPGKYMVSMQLDWTTTWGPDAVLQIIGTGVHTYLPSISRGVINFAPAGANFLGTVQQLWAQQWYQIVTADLPVSVSIGGEQLSGSDRHVPYIVTAIQLTGHGQLT